MAETNEKIMNLGMLTYYDEKIKNKIATDDATTLQSAKDYADEKVGEVVVPEYTIAKLETATEGYIASYQLKVETKDTSFEGDFIFGMVSNATSVGGFRKLTGSDVLLDDGVFEVLLVRRPKNILELNEIITALLGGADTSSIESFKTSYLKITSETQISWTLDGEFGGEHREVEIQNMNHAVNIILKKDEKVPLIQANTENIK